MRLMPDSLRRKLLEIFVTAYMEMDSLYFTLILYTLTKKRIKHVLPSVRLKSPFIIKIDILRQYLLREIAYNSFLSSSIFRIIGWKFSTNDYAPYCIYTERNILLLSICEILLLFFGEVTAVWRPECMAACHDTAWIPNGTPRSCRSFARNNIRRENYVAANSSV